MITPRRDIFIPVIVFVAAAALYICISLLSNNDLLFRPIWDIGHYQSIAERGYEVYPCDPAIHYPMGKICGNVGWFPLWPLVVKILSFGQVASGLLVLPYLFTMLGLMLFYVVMRDMFSRNTAVIACTALMGSPAAFYLFTGFPYALLLLLFSAYLYALYHPDIKASRFMVPAMAVLISLTYPSGFLTAIIPVVKLIREYTGKASRPSLAKLLRDSVFHVFPFLLGPLVLSIYFYFTFDDFLLILHFQEKYNRQWDFPLTVIWKTLRQFSLTTHAHFMNPAFTPFAANFTIIWYGMIFFIFAPYRLRTELFAYALLFFLFSPTTGSMLSVWRHYVLIFPAAMMIASSPRPFWIKYAYIALGLLIALGVYFPYFMKGYLI